MDKFIVSFIILSSLLCSSCSLRYSPYETSVDDSDTNQIEIQKQRLGSTTATSFSFALISDTHFYISGLDKTISSINAKRPTFTISCGDFSNQGLKFEYMTYLKQLRQLNNPFFSVIGNHDSIAYGKDLYHNIFGSENFTVQYGGVKLIFFNANSWEWGSVNSSWLKNEIDSFSGDKILISHVPLGDSERFTQSERDAFSDMIEGKVKLTINGHNHTYSYVKTNGTHHYEMTQTKDGQYDIINYNGGQLEIYRCVHSDCVQFTDLQ